MEETSNKLRKRSPNSPADLPLHRSTSDPGPQDSSLSQADIADNPFAGRLGGGQRFTLAPTTSTSEQAHPDAFRDAPWHIILSPSGFTDPQLYKLAFIEGVGTMLQTFISGLLGVGLVPAAKETSVGALLPVAFAAVAQILLTSLFIYTAGAVTGAHFNPLITFGTFCTRLSSLPRTALYITFQCLGAVVGAFLLRAALGASPSALAIVPGCYIDPSLVTPGEAFAFETMLAFATLFLAFGLGLDPRNNSSLSPALAPILIALTSALTVFAGGIARRGYLGASNNPARCLGLMAAAQRFDYHYIHWAGDATAAVVNGVLYWAVPPFTRARD